MKKTFKYMLVAAVALVSLASVASAHAAPQFVAGGSPYIPLVEVQDCGPSGNACATGLGSYTTSISGVQPGDDVWVMMYYNNQGTGTATNARFTLSPSSTGNVNSQTFSGTLGADNASQISGSATVNLSQAQTLTYYGARLYGHNGTFITSTTGNELFNGGLNIGSVQDPSSCSPSDTFCHQGVLVAKYRVGQAVVVNPQNCVINSFYANPTYVSSGSSSSLNWSTTGCSSVGVSGSGFFSSSLSGSQSTNPLYNTTSYTITAYGTGGQAPSQTVTVSVNPVYQNNNCYINNFTANPSWVTYGNTSNLTWNTTGCTSVNVTGPNLYSSYQQLSGSAQTGAIYGSSTYVLTAYGANGQTQTQSVTVSSSQIQTSCYIGSFYASPLTVTSGSSTTLFWTTSGATSVYVSGVTGNYNNYNNQSLSGSLATGAVYGSQTYTLTATCQNGQTQTQAVTVSASQPVQQTSVYTGTVTSVTQTSARLNGSLIQSNGYNTQVYFQWGTSNALGNVTTQQSAGSSSSTPFFNYITGLSADTTYYYRAVAVNSSGTFYGDTNSFSTLTANVYVPPTVVTVVQGVGSGSNLVSLDVNNNQPINVCVGNIVNYLVNYKNISGKQLDNVVLQVLLPQDVQFQSSNPGVYNAADHTITFSIGSLTKDQAGSMNVTGTVLRTAVDRNLIVASATIVFTNPTNKSQETAIAYGLGNTNNCTTNSLAGLALFGDGFWPTTLIGWLVLILILLLLIYLATVLFRNSRRPAVAGPTYNTNMGAGTMRPNNPMQPQQPPHYENMDIPTYSNHQ